MATSDKQLQANRANAAHSTGPRTSSGKAKSSMNAVTHGLFSKHLLLEGEQSEDYLALIEDLLVTLQPIGGLEHSLVERIAVNMWRQKRLIQAETAMVNLECKTSTIAYDVSRELGRTVAPLELGQPDIQEEEFCEEVLKEYKAMPSFSLKTLSEHAPTILKHLTDHAKSKGLTIETYLTASEGKLPKQLIDLVQWCNKMKIRAIQRPQVQDMAQKVKNRKSILPDNYLDLLSRYQTSLDNQLFKAMKALRESQQWRLQMQREINTDKRIQSMA
jgi:hypothetical protein